MDSISKVLQSYINNSSYTWVPIVAFVLVISIAGISGLINGWKTSLYFFGWNLVGWISGVFLLPTVIAAVDTISFVKVLISAAKDLLGIIALFLYLFVVNILAFLTYLLFRKKMKKTMKRNKTNKISNKYSRCVGFGIAISSSIPSAVFLANSSAIMSVENGYTSFLDSMTDKLTFGKYKGPSQARILAGNFGHISDFIHAIIGGNPEDLGSDLSKKALQLVLNTDFVKNVGDIYDGIKATGIIETDATLDTVEASDIIANLPKMGIKFENGKEKQLHDSLMKMFSTNDDAEAVVGAIISQLKA